MALKRRAAKPAVSDNRSSNVDRRILSLSTLGGNRGVTDRAMVLANAPAAAVRGKIAFVSNTDDDFLSRTVVLLGDLRATAVTAEQARAYKPNPGLFRHAFRTLGVAPTDVLHVAQGTFSDLAVCAALGVRAVWVNRQAASLQDGLEPFAVIEDLSGLPEIVRSLSR